jgi:tRNA-5-taurinomethyluridine 2-sulfurtransferase
MSLCTGIMNRVKKIQVSPSRLMANEVYVAMSGGVDSSTAAALLRQKVCLSMFLMQGYNIRGIFMRNWTDDGKHTPCRAETDWKDVQNICEHLSISCERVSAPSTTLTQIDLSREYWTEVFQPALDMYAAGATPNPDISCNREIKFGKLFQNLKARTTEQSWWLATGHYARSARNTKTGKSVLLRSQDLNKDQTFYLSQISQESLSRTLFPLAKFTKPQVREMAKSLLPGKIASKPDSQGLCFVEPSSGRHFSTFLKEYLPPPTPATVKLEDGRIVGNHPSLWLATIGERSRLNFRESQRLNPGGQWYVAAKSSNPPSYTIVPRIDHPMLYSRELIAKEWKWINEDEAWSGERPVAQIRHRQTPVPCAIERLMDGRVKVRFEDAEGVYGVTPGQAVAVWSGERCLGGGIIESSTDIRSG